MGGDLSWCYHNRRRYWFVNRCRLVYHINPPQNAKVSSIQDFDLQYYMYTTEVDVFLIPRIHLTITVDYYCSLINVYFGRPRHHLLGNIPDTELYGNTEDFRTTEVPDLKIFCWEALFALC